jgi:hypothetical protein
MKRMEVIPGPSFFGFEAIQIIPHFSKKSPVMNKSHVPDLMKNQTVSLTDRVKELRTGEDSTR